MKIIKSSIFFFLFLMLNTPLYSAGKLSEMFEMGYLSAPYHTSLDVGLRYSNPPTTLHIEISNNPNLLHDGNAPHIGHSFSDETMLYGYIADTFMNLILEKIKFVVHDPAPAISQEPSQTKSLSMDVLENAKASGSVHAGDKRTAEEAELQDVSATNDSSPQESESGIQSDEEIHPPVEEIKVKPTFGLLLNIFSKTSSHFIIPFASGKDGDLNRGLMTLAFTSSPDVIPSKEWIQYPGRMLSGQMVANIIQSTLLSKIKRTVDSNSTKNGGIYN